MNTVHEDENWRQRLRAEQAAAGQWRDQWGFLEHTKPVGSVHVDRLIPNRHLARTIAEQGILYPYLQQTYRQNCSGGSQPTFTVGGTARGLPAPTSVPQPKVWKGDPDAPRADNNWTTRANRAGQAIVNHQQQYSGTQTARSEASSSSTPRYPASPPPPSYPRLPTYASASSRFIPQPPATQRTLAPIPTTNTATTTTSSSTSIPPLNLAPLQSRPLEPILHLDLNLAKTMTPRYEQDVGSCVWTSGVDPAVKYRHPLTASHKIGWVRQATKQEYDHVPLFFCFVCPECAVVFWYC